MGNRTPSMAPLLQLHLPNMDLQIHNMDLQILSMDLWHLNMVLRHLSMDLRHLNTDLLHNSMVRQHPSMGRRLDLHLLTEHLENQYRSKYGPPIYGPPAQNLQVFYGMPHAMISIWDKLWEKLKWKINLFTFGKILLKLIIFKKIVSLIAIICLLLFIPSLKHKKLGFFHGDEGERSMQDQISVPDNDTLNSLSAFAIGSIENYINGYENYPASCDTTYCRVKKSLKKLDKRISYKKLATLYASESS